MNIKYRILLITFFDAEPIYVSQYKILGIWMNIGKYKNHFFRSSDTYCETLFEAQKRIELMQRNMKRAESWWVKSIHVYEEF